MYAPVVRCISVVFFACSRRMTPKYNGIPIVAVQRDVVFTTKLIQPNYFTFRCTYCNKYTRIQRNTTVYHCCNSKDQHDAPKSTSVANRLHASGSQRSCKCTPGALRVLYHIRVRLIVICLVSALYVQRCTTQYTRYVIF